MEVQTVAETISGRSLPELEHAIKEGPTDEAVRLLTGLIEEEREMSRLNILKPYEDKVPLVLKRLPVPRIVRLFEQLTDDLVVRALFGNFRTLEDEIIKEIAERMRPDRCARLFREMSLGVDRPKRIARIMNRLAPRALRRMVPLIPEGCVLQLLEECSAPEQARLFSSVEPGTAAKLLDAILAGRESAVRLSRAAILLKRVPPKKRDAIVPLLAAEHRDNVRAALERRHRGKLLRSSLPDAVLDLQRRSPEAAYRALSLLPPFRVVEILRSSPPEIPPEILTRYARENPGLAADILQALNTFVILRLSKSGDRIDPVTEMYSCRAAAALARMKLADEGVVRMLGAIPTETLELFCEYLPDKERDIITALLPHRKIAVKLPIAYSLFSTGKGRRTTTTFPNGLKWIHIEETLDTGEKVKPVVIDLVEIDPRSVEVRCCRAITEGSVLPVAEVSKIFGDARREGKRPDKEIFTRLGLIQLSRETRRRAAMAAINGNHYYDYGHYMDALKLGIDPNQVPGLFFGDPVGWFVEEGVEVSPPSFNRSALVITREGGIFLQKVFMTQVTLPNGKIIVWDDLNCNKRRGKILLYNSLFGFHTEEEETHVDLACAKNRIFEIRERGGGLIPFTGFVLSIPVERRHELLAGVKVGDAIQVGNNFPASHGTVWEAMACGPSLVCDRQLDISFKAEDFGEKDSSVMSFSLTRAVETFEAARSFVAIRGSRFIIGTVSGTALGTGAPTVSGGMTFGELAQLTLDLQVDQAMALDGGGSSSIVVEEGDGVRVLNVPTGGSDVKEGEERFINTYLLIFKKGEGAHAR